MKILIQMRTKGLIEEVEQEEGLDFVDEAIEVFVEYEPVVDVKRSLT